MDINISLEVERWSELNNQKLKKIIKTPFSYPLGFPIGL